MKGRPMKRQTKRYGEECATCRGGHDPIEHGDRLDVRRRRDSRVRIDRIVRGTLALDRTTKYSEEN